MSLFASYLLLYALFSYSRGSPSSDTVVSWWSVDHEFESKNSLLHVQNKVATMEQRKVVPWYGFKSENFFALQGRTYTQLNLPHTFA